MTAIVPATASTGWIEARHFTRAEICRVFAIPPGLLRPPLDLFERRMEEVAVREATAWRAVDRAMASAVRRLDRRLRMRAFLLEWRRGW